MPLPPLRLGSPWSVWAVLRRSGIRGCRHDDDPPTVVGTMVDAVAEGRPVRLRMSLGRRLVHLAHALALALVIFGGTRFPTSLVDGTGLTVHHGFVRHAWDWDEIHDVTTGWHALHRLVGVDNLRPGRRRRRERGDVLNRLGLHGLSPATTIPDRYGLRATALTALVGTCARRLRDGRVTVPESAAGDPAVTAVARVALGSLGYLLITAIALAMFLSGEPDLIIAALFCVPLIVSVPYLVLRNYFRRRSSNEPGGRIRSSAPSEETDAELRTHATAVRSQQDVATVRAVLHAADEGHRHRPPLNRGQEVDAVLARVPSLGRDTVHGILDAHEVVRRELRE